MSKFDHFRAIEEYPEYQEYLELEEMGDYFQEEANLELQEVATPYHVGT